MPTPTDVSRAHGRAIYDLLAPLSGAPCNYQRYFAKVDVGDDALRYPYLIVWAQPGTRGQINMAGNVYDLTTVTQITAVGQDDDEVLAALDQAGALLQGIRPAIDGRLPGQIRQIPTSQPVRETDQARTPAGQPYYMAIALYSLNSTAGPVSP